MARLGNITFACSDPATLAEFWAAALEYEIQPPPPGLVEAIEAADGDTNAAAAAIDPDDAGPRLYFKKGPKSTTEHIPIHLDIEAADRDAEVERLVKLGATTVETKSESFGPHTDTWTVMQDPEGNGFCVQGSRPDQ